ncbi:MAG: NifB/NifX family molybdenum-iron cluster-binding protein [Acidobacteriota bacterium]
MKIAVTATKPDLSAQVDPRFGRSPYFIIVDSETMDFEVIENSSAGAASGAGIQAAQLVANKGIELILTGSCGPNAFQTFQAAGVKIIVGVSGTIKQAVQQYKSGNLNQTAQANVPPHFGMGRGRGMGRGMGRSMGGGRSQRPGYTPFDRPPRAFPSSSDSPQPSQASQPSPDQELDSLKKQAENLSNQLKNISKKIEELEKKNK